MPPEEDSAGRYKTDDFPETDCTAADSDVSDMNDMISHRLCLPPEEVSAGLDGTNNFPETDCATADSGAAHMNNLIFRLPGDDSATVDYDTGAVGLDDLVFCRLSFPPDGFAGEEDPAVDAGDAMTIGDMIVRSTKLLPNEFSAGWNGDYIWLNSGTSLSVCAIPVTGSLRFGHSPGLLSLYCLESVPQTQSCHCQTTIVRVMPDICYSHHAGCIERYVIRSSIIVVLLIWYCSGVFRIRAMASDGLPDSSVGSLARNVLRSHVRYTVRVFIRVRVRHSGCNGTSGFNA